MNEVIKLTVYRFAAEENNKRAVAVGMDIGSGVSEPADKVRLTGVCLRGAVHQWMRPPAKGGIAMISRDYQSLRLWKPN